ncbi:MAG: hypothetical protein VYE68_09610 [Acidobacteriota bacterium]|nr:hypothetical protein [Acidobacteriota bacterium]
MAAICTNAEELWTVHVHGDPADGGVLLSTFYVIANPRTLATRTRSLLPRFTPLVMLARVNGLRPPL